MLYNNIPSKNKAYLQTNSLPPLSATEIGHNCP